MVKNLVVLQIQSGILEMVGLMIKMLLFFLWIIKNVIFIKVVIVFMDIVIMDRDGDQELTCFWQVVVGVIVLHKLHKVRMIIMGKIIRYLEEVIFKLLIMKLIN